MKPAHSWRSAFSPFARRGGFLHTSNAGIIQPRGGLIYAPDSVVFPLMFQSRCDYATRVERSSLIEFRRPPQNDAEEGPTKYELGIVLERKRSLQRSKTRKFTLTVKGEDGTTINIPERTVSYQWPETVDTNNENLLRSIREQVNNLIQVVRRSDLEALWTKYAKQTKNVPITIEAVAKKLFKGKTAVQIYAAQKVLEREKVFFRRKESKWYCRSAEGVQEKLEEQALMKQEAKMEEQFLCRLRRYAMRKLERDPSPDFTLPPVPSRLQSSWEELEEEEDWEMTEEELQRLEEWKKSIAAQICSATDSEAYMNQLLSKKKLPEQAEELTELHVLAGAKRKSKEYVLSLMIKLGLFVDRDDLDAINSTLPLVFTAEEEAEAKRLLNDPPQDVENRIDFKELVSVAIDPEEALERDDAYSVAEKDGEDWILVHIADATRWLHPLSTLDKAAETRGSAIYLAGGRKVNMIPQSLSRAAMALSSDRENLALTFAARLNADGSLAEYRVLPSVISPVCVLSYEQMDAILNDSTHPDHFRSHIGVAYSLAKKRQEWRIQRGAQFLDLSNVGHRKVDPAHLKTGGRPPKGSKMVVNEFLLLAGEVAAAFAEEKNLPFLYRKQGRPRDMHGYFAYLMRPPPSDSELVRVHKLRKMTQPQDLSRERNAHFSLALDRYSPINAPLRRYADLLLHYQIKGLFLRGVIESLQDFRIQSKLLQLKEQLQGVEELEEATKSRWVTRYFEQRRGELHTAVVVEVQPVIIGGSTTAQSRATIVFPSLPNPHNEWKTIIDVPKSTKCGAVIQVRAAKANAFTNVLSFDLH